MDFFEATVSGFRNYTRCAGRASRSEYWYWFLFCLIGDQVTTVMDMIIFHVPYDTSPLRQPISLAFSLITLVPSIAVAVRRLHDINRSGRWFYIGFTVIGAIYPLMFWYCKKGTEGSNRFGADPLSSSVADSLS